jgi:hypothetical protein
MPWQRRPGPGGCWWSPDAGLVLATAVGLLRLLVAVPEEIEAVARRVRERAPGDRQALLLATVPGLGYYTALLARAENKGCLPLPYGQAAIELRRPGALHLRLWQGGEACGHSQEGLQLPQVGAGGDGHACRGAAWAPAWVLPAAAAGQGRPEGEGGSGGGAQQGGPPDAEQSRSYRKVGPCLAPQGQADSEAYVAGG